MSDPFGDRFADYEMRAIYDPYDDDDRRMAIRLLMFDPVPGECRCAPSELVSCEQCGAVLRSDVGFLVRHRQGCGWP